MRNSTIISFFLIISSVFYLAQGAVADEVILTTGEHFTSSKVWEEDGKILFDMQGLIVHVNKKEVVAIVHGSSPAEPPVVPPANPIRGDQEPLSPALNSWPPENSAPPEKSLPTTNQESPNPKPKVRGIGIDGLAWQMRPNQIAGIAKLGTDPSYGGIDQYWRPSGKLTFGSALLDGLVFGFWQNRLYTIVFWVNGSPGYHRLRQAVFEHYGSGRKNDKGLERYIWLDDTTDRMLEFDQKRNAGIFWMRCRDLDEQVKRLYPEDGGRLDSHAQK
jgi:hypothetical protein